MLCVKAEAFFGCGMTKTCTYLCNPLDKFAHAWLLVEFNFNPIIMRFLSLGIAWPTQYSSDQRTSTTCKSTLMILVATWVLHLLLWQHS